MSGARVIQSIVDGGESLDKCLQRELEKSEEKPAALKELCYGGCRHYHYLDGILASLMADPLRKKDRRVHFLLVGALYRIEFMAAPDYRVVNETVSSLSGTKFVWAKKLVNGVLRNFIRNRDGVLSSLGPDHVKAAMPAHLYASMKKDWPQYLDRIIGACNEKPPLTLRVNQRVMNRSGYERILRQQDIEYCVTRDSGIGITLLKPVGVSDIPRFRQGAVSVQDESAQLISLALSLEPNHTVLDGCAAPGGKTCLMLEMQPELEELVAVDFPDRIHLIEENLDRTALKATVIGRDITRMTQWWRGKAFDRILLDVPCSGSGIIRRRPDIKHRRRASDIGRFADRQLDILRSVWPLLRGGGELLYVTCSIFRHENDGVIEKFLDDADQYELQSPGGEFAEKLGVATRYGRQRLPGVHDGDGFYYASIKKN